MYTIHASGKEYGPFGSYQNALKFSSENWKQTEFYITGPHDDHTVYVDQTDEPMTRAELINSLQMALAEIARLSDLLAKKELDAA